MKNASLVVTSRILERYGESVSRIRPSAGDSVFGLTRRGILVCQRAKGHIFGLKPKLRCRPDATSAITGNLFSGRMPALPGVICKCGPSFTKRVSKCREWETLTPSLTTSKRNTNLHRNYSARFAGTSNSSATSVIASSGSNVRWSQDLARIDIGR